MSVFVWRRGQTGTPLSTCQRCGITFRGDDQAILDAQRAHTPEVCERRKRTTMGDLKAWHERRRVRLERAKEEAG